MEQLPSVNFMVYDNRSGSTMVAALLDSFDEIGITLESPRPIWLLVQKKSYRGLNEAKKALSFLYADRKFREWGIARQQLEERIVENLPLQPQGLFQLLLQSYFESQKPQTKCWIYKGVYPYAVARIKQIFPKAKFVFVHRDGRAVFNSKKRTFSRKINDIMENNPDQAAKTWISYFAILEKLTGRDDFVEVKYENLVCDTSQELSRMASFLMGNECRQTSGSNSSQSYQSKIPVSQSHLHPNIGKPPMISRIDAWKKEMNWAEIYIYERRAHLFLAKKGYDVFYYGKSLSEKEAREVKMLDLKLTLTSLKRRFFKIIGYLCHPAEFLIKLGMRIGW
jgi:hypothetical protein